MLLPRLYRIAIPILKRKNTGIRKESIVSERTIVARSTAIATYIGVSFSAIFLVSVTIADIPLRKHFSLAMDLICSIASIVPSADVVSSNIRNINVASPLLNASYTSVGSISIGTLKSMKLSYQITFST